MLCLSIIKGGLYPKPDPPPVNLVTSTQLPEDAKTIPNVELNRKRENNTVMIIPFLSPTKGTNNTYPT